MYTSISSVEYAVNNKMTSTTKGFDSQRLVTEFITSEGAALPEDVDTDKRLASVIETLDRCPNAPAIPCNVTSEAASPFDETGLQMPVATRATSHTENCLAGFQSSAGFVEDTSAFQEEISQLDMAAWGDQVAG